ncbi:MAG: hypothetical protein AAFO69_01975 [Bacteroidota bacterium]
MKNDSQSIDQENELVKFIFYPDLSLAEEYFKPVKEPIFPQRYQQIMSDFATFCEIHQPSNLLINMRDKAVILEEDIQQWMKEDIYPRLAASGAVRKGYLVPDDFYSQLSIANSAKNTINSEQRYFETREQAIAWFQSL